jgi:aspartyl-tRNA synthetase
MYRTHTCGELNAESIGKVVKLAGWTNSRRDHGGVIFIDLRDRYGFTQIVFDPSHDKIVHSDAEKIGREFVLCVSGTVRRRPEGMTNPKLKTGEIEVLVDELTIISKSKVPPIEIDDRIDAGEDMRLKYRYLDLRRPKMQQLLMTRHKAAQAAREYFAENGFIEIETPLLIRSTPEGARDYVVPSRVSPGCFYALPQSPQLYKQILMVAGMDRYFQLARCLRDEDLRADRQPEHTQMDLEMSFVTAEDIRLLVEGLYKHLFKKVLGQNIKTPFPVIKYKDSMSKYGIDKPDLRFGMELIDVSDIVKKSDFKVFAEMEQIKCLVADKDFSRNEIDALIEWAKANGAKGLAWMRVTEKGVESSIVKYFSEDLQKQIVERTNAKKGSVIFFVADKPKAVAEVLSKLRLELGKKLKLIDETQFNFCWVVDFPLFEWNDEENNWQPAHHMFTMPKKEHFEFIEKSPEKVEGDLYDLVLNGVELGSGSIRITDVALQERVMNVVGFKKEDAEKRFGFLLEAFEYGAPPHGGMGLGFDRTVALMCGFNDIREVIAFPKNKKAENPMDGSPNEIEDKQLKELHIKLDKLKP